MVSEPNQVANVTIVAKPKGNWRPAKTKSSVFLMRPAAQMPTAKLSNKYKQINITSIDK